MKTDLRLFDDAPLRLTAFQRAARDGINDKIRSSAIALEAVPCLCGSSSLELLSSTDRYGILQPTQICRACGLVQSNPRMSADNYQIFYSSDAYRRLYDGEDYGRDYVKFLTPEHGQGILAAVRSAHPTAKSVVEIGSGGGRNLVAFQNAGFEVMGWDLSGDLIKVGQQFGLPMRRGSIDEALAEGRRFDVIVLNHVLEHFLDPLSELKKLHELIQPGGCFYVGVPAMDYPALTLLQNAHVYYFSDKTLQHYLAATGWQSSVIVHLGPFAMFTVAREGSAEPKPLDNEYADSTARLAHNKKNARRIVSRDRKKAIIRSLLSRFGLLGVAAALRRKSARRN